MPSIRSCILSLPLLRFSVTASPAGPGYFAPNHNSTSLLPSGTSGPTEISNQAAGLIENYDSSNWFNQFDVQAIADPTLHGANIPTDGFVKYVNQQEAQDLGLLKIRGNQVYMGVDTTTSLDSNGEGRKSVRIQSKRSYNGGLIIADFAHIPGSQCGTWPAFWMVGPNWPNQGELDIIEGVHQNTVNQVTLHTSPGCNVAVGPGGQSGTSIGPTDCGAGNGAIGCGVMANSPTSYGSPFNAHGGGVYATQWTNSGIKVWYFATRDVPADIRNGNPNSGSWGQPIANFAGCDFAAKFRDMRIVFDITFCGDWAGAVWGASACSAINPSCKAYVATQPQSFVESYWLINSVKVYSV